MPTIKLQSSDGVSFDVELKVAQHSNLIKTMLQDLGVSEENDECIPVPNVDAKTLEKIVTWATHHKDDLPEEEDDENKAKSKRGGIIDTWDAEFLNMDQSELFELMTAANYLDMKGLLDITCEIVANMIKGKKPDEIRKLFNLKNDLAEEEDERTDKENDWCEEK